MIVCRIKKNVLTFPESWLDWKLFFNCCNLLKIFTQNNNGKFPKSCYLPILCMNKVNNFCSFKRFLSNPFSFCCIVLCNCVLSHKNYLIFLICIEYFFYEDTIVHLQTSRCPLIWPIAWKFYFMMAIKGSNILLWNKTWIQSRVALIGKVVFLLFNQEISFILFINLDHEHVLLKRVGFNFLNEDLRILRFWFVLE